MIIAKQSTVSSIPLTFKHVLDLNKPLEYSEDWVDELDTLRNANPDDQVLIRIACDGGDANIMQEWLSSIYQCKATVSGEITGQCCSAATFIFLACDQYVVNEGSNMMLHTAQCGTGYGNERNVQQRAEWLKKSTRKLLDKHYKYFCTEDEIDDIARGDELYLDSEEIIERLSRRKDAMESDFENNFKDADIPPKEVLAEWDKDRLLSFLYDENYNDDDWEDTEPSETPEESYSKGKYEKIAELTDKCIGGDLSEGYVSFHNDVVVVDCREIFRKGLLVDFDLDDVKELKLLADDLGVQYHKTATQKQMVKIIQEFVDKVVAILKS